MIKTVGQRVDDFLNELENDIYYECEGCEAVFPEDVSGILISNEGSIDIVCPFCNSPEIEKTEVK